MGSIFWHTAVVVGSDLREVAERILEREGR